MERPGFTHGVVTGLAAFIVLAQVLLALSFPDMRSMYRDISPDMQLPLVTQITMHPAWIWGAPLAGIGTIALMLGKRPRSMVVYILVVVALAAILVLSWWGPRIPIFALAGNIRAD